MKFLSVSGDPSTLWEFDRYFVWLGYQSGPNERKVEMWVFGHGKQSIILSSSFLGIYLGGHRGQDLGGGIRHAYQTWSAFSSIFSPGLHYIPGKDQGLFVPSDLTVLI